MLMFSLLPFIMLSLHYLSNVGLSLHRAHVGQAKFCFGDVIGVFVWVRSFTVIPEWA